MNNSLTVNKKQILRSLHVLSKQVQELENNEDIQILNDFLEDDFNKIKTRSNELHNQIQALTEDVKISEVINNNRSIICSAFHTHYHHLEHVKELVRDKLHGGILNLEKIDNEQKEIQNLLKIYCHEPDKYKISIVKRK